MMPEDILPNLKKFLQDTGKDWNYVLPEELHKLIDQGEDLFILDIRKPEDFARGHIPGATNIFWKEILTSENLSKLPKNKKIVVVCYVGHTASQVMTILRLLGYDAVALKFGMGVAPDPAVPVKGWLGYGFETETSEKSGKYVRVPGKGNKPTLWYWETPGGERKLVDQKVSIDGGIAIAPHEIKFEKHIIPSGTRVRWRGRDYGGDYQVELMTDKGETMGFLIYDNRAEFKDLWKVRTALDRIAFTMESMFKEIRDQLNELRSKGNLTDKAKKDLDAVERGLDAIERSTKKIVEAAIPRRYSHISFIPPKSVAEEAERGLEYRRKAGGKGGLSHEEAKKEGVGSGVQRAVNLKNRNEISPETVRRMKSFFDRHQKNKTVDPKYASEPWKDRGYVAWLLWGGDSGYTWAKKIVNMMDKADEESSKKVARIFVSRFGLSPETFSGGFDIMKRWQEEHTTAPSQNPPEYESGGFDVMKRQINKPKKTDS